MIDERSLARPPRAGVTIEPPRAHPSHVTTQWQTCRSVRGILWFAFGHERQTIHDTPVIQSLDRGAIILEAVAASARPVPLKQLTNLIGIDRSSVFRLVNTLRQRRFLASVAGQTGEYAPLHCTAHGEALVTDCDPPALRVLLGRGPLRVYTRTALKSVRRLVRVCARRAAPVSQKRRPTRLPRHSPSDRTL